MIVFLDTNILLDVALRRRGFHDESEAAMVQCESLGLQTFVAWHTITNAHYVLNRLSTREKALQFLSQLITWVRIAPTNLEILTTGLATPGKDFEDTLQYLCAEAAGCDVLVTRNPKDFGHSTVEISTPGQFLQRVLSSGQ